ncbi:MAG: peptide deformylase [Bacteroidales bacterium]|nr:peptide deformylase [Bacteroidales bacterium]
MILPIYVYGSPVLREPAKDVDTAEEKRAETKKLIDDMYQTMKNAEGCGIAAPQVGVSKRILIVEGVDLVDRFPELADFMRVMINPTIIEQSDETSVYGEGCLSIPDVNADVERPKKIKVHYLNGDFQEVTEEFDDFAARMVQHEMDHLKGQLFTDLASPIRKKLLATKLGNIAKGKAHTFYKIKLQK